MGKRSKWAWYQVLLIGAALRLLADPRDEISPRILAGVAGDKALQEFVDRRYDIARLAADPATADRSMGWLLAMSTLNPDKRDALQQGELL